MKAPSLVIAVPKDRGDSHDSEGDGEEEKDSGEADESDEMEAADQVADVLDVPDDKREALYQALRAFTKACMSNY